MCALEAILLVFALLIFLETFELAVNQKLSVWLVNVDENGSGPLNTSRWTAIELIEQLCQPGSTRLSFIPGSEIKRPCFVFKHCFFPCLRP
jgi:hypothetical protein